MAIFWYVRRGNLDYHDTNPCLCLPHTQTSPGRTDPHAHARTRHQNALATHWQDPWDRNPTLMPYTHLVSFLQDIGQNTNHLFVTSLCELLEVCTRYPSGHVLYPGQIVHVLVAPVPMQTLGCDDRGWSICPQRDTRYGRERLDDATAPADRASAVTIRNALF